MDLPRFAVGTFESSGITTDLAAGLRELGCTARTVMRLGHPFFGHQEYGLDVSAAVDTVDWGALERAIVAGPPLRGLHARSSPFDRLRWVIEQHDVFVFIGLSLRSEPRRRFGRLTFGAELPLLRRLGKKIVSLFIGPDVRHASAFDQELAELDGGALRLGDLEGGWGELPVAPALAHLRRAELYSDLILSQPNQSGLALRPYGHLLVPIDLERLRPEIPGREVPVVVHAPSGRAIKGTAHVLAALDRLARDGVRFELRLLEGRPNPEVLAELHRADVVIDQLHLPLHGRLGVEAMAAGCAVATCDRPSLEPYPAARPLWHVDPTNLEPRLRTLLTDRALRLRLAAAGRTYVERHHDRRAVARGLVDAVAAPARALVHHPRFFAERYRLPSGVRLSRRLRSLTRRVATRWGLPAGTTLESLAERGLA